jgi:hypothetical protein
MLDGNFYFECICGCDEHTIRFTLDKEEKEIYTSVFLASHRNFFVRIWLGIKYIFGGKSRYGQFGNWTLSIHDADRIERMLNMLKEFKDGTS